MNRQKSQFLTKISAHMNKGQVNAAENEVRAALKLFPDEFVFISYLGMVKIQQRQPKEAVKQFKKALKYLPKSEEGWRNLGGAEQALGNYAAALSSFQKALRINPKFYQGWFSLAKLFRSHGQDEKAIDAYQNALKLKPDFAIAGAELMDLLERTNRIDELGETLAKISESAPDNAISQLFEGVLSYRKKEYDTAREALESFTFPHANSLNLIPFELRRVRFLARSFDALNKPELAYKYLELSKNINRALHVGDKVDPTSYRATLKKRVEYYSPPILKSWAIESKFEDAPVFLIGFPRSGTTLLDTFLRGHKGISVLEERPLVGALRNALGTGSQSSKFDLDTINNEQIAAARHAYFEALKAEKTSGLAIDKLPLNLIYAGEILRVFPNAKFIFVLRDPADAVLSCFMQTFKLNDSMATLETPLEAAKTYDSAMQIWQNTVRHLNPNFVTSRYEDLVSNPENTLKPLLAFLDVPWNSDILDHAKTAKKREKINTPSYLQVVEPIYSTSISRWERYADLMPEALEILSPWRKEFGYSD